MIKTYEIEPFILFHSMVYLNVFLDSKNIKESLNHITKYIRNKKIKKNKANNISDFSNIGEAAWNFILALYNLGWDILIVNKNNCSFRQKVSAQFTLKLSKIKTNNKNNKKIDKPASFIKLSPLTLAKLPKKFNKISKFFKKNN